MPDTFASWFMAMTLYMYLALNRIQQEGESLRDLKQTLHLLFWDDVEMRLSMSGIKSSASIRGYQRLLYSKYLGQFLAFDEGVLEGDMALAGCFWRCVFYPNTSLSLCVFRFSPGQ
jgi:hypothetical protein